MKSQVGRNILYLGTNYKSGIKRPLAHLNLLKHIELISFFIVIGGSKNNTATNPYASSYTCKNNGIYYVKWGMATAQQSRIHCVYHKIHYAHREKQRSVSLRIFKWPTTVRDKVIHSTAYIPIIGAAGIYIRRRHGDEQVREPRASLYKSSVNHSTYPTVLV